MQRRTALPTYVALAREEVPRFRHEEERHAVPGPRTWVASKIAAQDVYIGLVIGAHTAKNDVMNVTQLGSRGGTPLWT